MTSVIVLNSNYEFWTEVTVHKVLKWISKNKIEIVLEHESEEIRSITLTIKMPVVVRLLNFVSYKIKGEITQYSDQAVFNRDSNICQYYHRDENGKKYKYQCTEDETTIDHVLPKSRGGKSTFENTVCCCRWHNEVVKKNMTPEEAGIDLIRKPSMPRQKRGDFAVFRFAYNPRRLSHVYYMEKWLKKSFTHKIV